MSDYNDGGRRVSIKERVGSRQREKANWEVAGKKRRQAEDIYADRTKDDPELKASVEYLKDSVFPADDIDDIVRGIGSEVKDAEADLEDDEDKKFKMKAAAKAMRKGLSK